MAHIAAAAGLGVATLYRHFPDRQALIDALQVRALQMVVDLVDEILDTDQSGIEALETFLVRTVQHRNDLFLPYHGAPPTSDPDFARLNQHLRGRVGRLLGRGATDHTLRTDLTVRDLIIFGALMASPLPHVENWQDAAHRQISFFLRAVAAPTSKQPFEA